MPPLRYLILILGWFLKSQLDFYRGKVYGLIFNKKRITFINIFGLLSGTKGAGSNLSSSAMLSNR